VGMPLKWQRFAVPLLLILLGGMTLRFYDLGAKGLRGDEIFTDLRSAESIREIWSSSSEAWTAGQREIDSLVARAPLLYFLTRATRLLGEGPLFLRLQAAFAGVLGIALAFALGTRLYDVGTGMLAAGLLAISPLHVYFSQDARYYPLLLALALLSAILLLKAFKANRAGTWLAYTAATVLMNYLHYFGLLVLASEIAIALTWTWIRSSPRRIAYRRLKRFALSLALIVLLCLPMAPTWYEMVRQYGLGGGELMGVEIATLRSGWVADWLVNFGGGPGVQAWILAGAAAISLFCSLLRGRKGRPSLAFVSLWLAVPFLPLLVLQPAKSLSYRHLIFLLPVYLLLAAYGVQRTLRLVFRGTVGRWRSQATSQTAWALSLLVLLILAALSATPLRAYYRVEKQNWRAAAALIDQMVQPGEVVTVPSAYRSQCIQYYASDQIVPAVTTAFDDWYELVRDHGGVWWVRAAGAADLSDPQIESWLREQGIEAVVFEGSWSPVLLYHLNPEVPAQQDRQALLETATNLVPEDRLLAMSLADLYRESGAWQAALVEYERALVMAPDLRDAQVGLGLIWYEQGRFPEAIIALEQAIRMDPLHGLSYRLLGDSYSGLGRWDRAVSAYERALTVRPDFGEKAWFLLRLGQAYSNAGQAVAARETFERVLRLDPGNEIAQEYLGGMLP
jgi:mannosyltransferase